MAEPQPAPHEFPLTLKVMRLCQPSFHAAKPALVAVDHDQHASLSSHASLQFDPPTAPAPAALPDVFPLTPSMVLPQAFGNIYRGETFSCYVSLSNHVAHLVHTVSLKAELQTSHRIFKLLDEPNLNPIPVGGSVDHTIRHHLKDVGMHMLLVEAVYQEGSERKVFKKYFRFQVLSPLQVASNTAVIPGKVVIETQVQNVTPIPIMLDSVRFVSALPAPAVDVSPVAPPSLADPFNESVADSTLLSPGDVVHRVHILPLPQSLNNSGDLGKVELEWKNGGGLSGHITFPLIRFKDPNTDEIAMHALDPPTQVPAAQPFEIRISIQNRGSAAAPLELHFAFDQMSDVIACGKSGVPIPEIAPGSNRVVSVTFVGVTTGMHAIKGVRLVHKLTGAAFQAHNLATVFVMPPIESPSEPAEQ